MYKLSLVILASVLFLGCAREGQKAMMQATIRPEANAEMKLDDSLVKKAAMENPSFDRKIIRKAELTIEVPSTIAAQQKVTSIAETNGGFVVTSEAIQRENDNQNKRLVDVKLVLRIPSANFNEALTQIQNLATNLPVNNVNSQDVSEEFIDLEARVRTQRALELQFLEIMKRANKVEEALEVQRQVAEVRTEIEKIEGRKRFLENQSSLSTITVNIQTPLPIVVTASGFRHTVRESASQSLDLAEGIVLFFVRFVIVMTPIFVMIVLPLGLIALYFRRRALRIRLAQKLEAAESIAE